MDLRTTLLFLGAAAAYFGVMTVLLLVHEAGHFLAGWLVGLRWQVFHVGPIQVKRGKTRLQLASDEN
jgi:membrane-associated protease RseP (regulator of RpoE activity)